MRCFLFLGLVIGFLGRLHAQELSGKWKGYFIPNNEQEGRIYIYDLEIQEADNHQLTASTFTNLSGSFSAKAIAKGFHSVKTQLVSITETKFEDVNVLGNMQACLMTNYLTYTNNRGRGILQGTYISSNASGTKDCGGGKVYLEKDFIIEKLDKNSFTKNKPKQLQKNKEPLATYKYNKPIAAAPPSDKLAVDKKSKNKWTVIAPLNTANSAIALNQETGELNSKNSSNSTNVSIINNDTKLNLAKIETPEPTAPIKKIEPEQTDADARNIQNIPWVLLGRENKLIKHVVTSNKKVTIDLYDNGTIDNDTINIYDNKQLISNKRRLSFKAIHLEVDFSNGVKEHEIIIVAHNMGSIPPNTALFVLTDGDSRQEYFITTTDKVNAKFEFVYKPTD